MRVILTTYKSWDGPPLLDPELTLRKLGELEGSCLLLRHGLKSWPGDVPEQGGAGQWPLGTEMVGAKRMGCLEEWFPRKCFFLFKDNPLLFLKVRTHFILAKMQGRVIVGCISRRHNPKPTPVEKIVHVRVGGFEKRRSRRLK